MKHTPFLVVPRLLVPFKEYFKVFEIPLLGTLAMVIGQGTTRLVIAEEFQPLYNHNISELYLQPWKHFRLAEDIYDSGLNIEQRPENFTGWLDGDGHAFFRLNLSSNNTSLHNYGGLFHRIQGGAVGNMTFYQSFISGFGNTGLLAGELVNGVVDRVRLMGGLVFGESGGLGEPYAGAVAGRAVNSSVSNIEVALNVTGGVGKPGVSKPQGSRGNNGAIMQDGEDGEDGEPGTRGGDGVGVGALIGNSVNNVIERLLLLANSTFVAGDGGTGGNGGDGGRGGRGGDSISTWRFGDGGDGGNGGNGGDGGDGGNVGLFARRNGTSVLESLLLNAVFVPGRSGVNGTAGVGGVGGGGGGHWINNKFVRVGLNGEKGTTGSDGAVGTTGDVTLENVLFSPNDSPVYWQKELSELAGGYTAVQLRQPDTFTKLNNDDWRIQSGYYPYPLALDSVYRPAEPYLASANQFAYPRIVHPYLPLVDLNHPLGSDYRWLLISASSFADFLRPIGSGNPAAIDTKTPVPDALFEYWAPDGMIISAHRITPDGRHLLLWHHNGYTQGRLTDFSLTVDEPRRFQAGGLAVSIPNRPVDLIQQGKQILVVGDDSLWRLNSDNQLTSLLKLDAGVEIKKVLAHNDHRLWLLEQSITGYKLVGYHYGKDEGALKEFATLPLPETLHAVHAVMVGNALCFVGKSVGRGDYPFYRLEASGNTLKHTVLADPLTTGMLPETVRLFWCDNALHLVAHDGSEITLLHLTEHGEVIRSGRFLPDGLGSVVDLGLKGGEKTLTLTASGVEIQGLDDGWNPVKVADFSVPYLYSTVCQLTGKTIEPLFNHNFTEVYRNPDGAFYLAEDIGELKNADLRAPVFRGKLDGRNHVIHRLDYTSVPPLGDGGLFHHTANASIGNLTFYNSRVTGGPYSGLLSGQSEGSLFENLRLMGGLVRGTALPNAQSWASALVGRSTLDRFRNIEIAVSVWSEFGLGGVDGADGADGTQPPPQSAPSPLIPANTPSVKVAPDGYDGHPGGDGVDGEPGGPGHPGVHAAVLAGVSNQSDYSHVVSRLNVSITAGDGGQGGRGGSGGHGGRGNPGTTGGSVNFTSAYQSGYWPGSGGNGGAGGNGGNGGDGGSSGVPGQAGLIIDSEGDSLSELVISGIFTQGKALPGQGGERGSGGSAGQAGVAGSVLFFDEAFEPENFTQPDVHGTSTDGMPGLPGRPGQEGTVSIFLGESNPLTGIVCNDGSSALANQKAPDLRNGSNYNCFDPVSWRISRDCVPYPVSLDSLYSAHNGGRAGGWFCYPDCYPDVVHISKQQALAYKRLWSSVKYCITHYPFSSSAVIAVNNDTVLSAEPLTGQMTQLHRFELRQQAGRTALVEKSAPIQLDRPVLAMNGGNGGWFLLSQDSVSLWSEGEGVQELTLLPDKLTYLALLDRKDNAVYLSVYDRQTLQYGIVCYRWIDSARFWQPERLERSFDDEIVAAVAGYTVITHRGDQWYLDRQMGQSDALLVNDWLPDEIIEELQVAEDPVDNSKLHFLIRTDQKMHWFRTDLKQKTPQKALVGVNASSAYTGFDVEPVNGTLQIFVLKGLNVHDLEVLSSTDQAWTEPEANQPAYDGGKNLEGLVGGILGGIVLSTTVFSVSSAVFVYLRHRYLHGSSRHENNLNESGSNWDMKILSE